MILSVLLRIGAIILALGAGWTLRRPIPTMQTDWGNKDSKSSPRRKSDSGEPFFSGFSATALGIASLIVGYFAWGNDVLPSYSGAIFSPPLILAVVAIGGNIARRLTDKKPAIHVE